MQAKAAAQVPDVMELVEDLLAGRNDARLTRTCTSGWTVSAQTVS